MTISRTICLGFMAVITIGAILLMLPISMVDGHWHSPVVALFTSTSAVCVTGLIVVDTGTYFSGFGQAVILLLIQLGGLGYMTITTFLMLLLRKKFDFSQKFAIQESFDRPFLLGSRNLIISILATTLVFELTGVFFLFQIFAGRFGVGQGLWLSIFHSISAWNNAGFSLFADSLIGYQSHWGLNLVISGLIIFGGIGYQTIIEMFYWVRDRLTGEKQRAHFSLNFKVVTSTTIFLLLLGTVAFFLTELTNEDMVANVPIPTQILESWFQSVTTRTAGFNTIDLAKMTETGLFITIVLMFIGASPSGTGGGIKTTTVRILASCTRSILQGKEGVTIYQRSIPINLILKAVGVIFGSIMTVAIATTLISLTDSNFRFIELCFEVVSAFATVGLSVGITAKLSLWGQLILIAIMYIGRVAFCY
ncbi:MAG: ATPase [Synechococcaceae cyanobacterium RL_1_2]|nr:ATPase [Synechococcaceae cyanobacterium RL_1_2]